MFDKKTNKEYKKNQVLIAGYIDKKLAFELDLLLLFKNISRTTFIKEIIKNAVSKENSTMIIQVLAGKIYKEWKAKYKRKKFDSFLNELKLKLEKKNINEMHISKILIESKKVYKIAENKKEK